MSAVASMPTAPRSGLTLSVEATANPQRLELCLDRVLTEDSIDGVFRD